MKNPEIARIFREIAGFLEMDEVPFKPRAYEKAAQSVEALREPVEDVYEEGGLKALEKLPGVGKSMAAKIREYLDGGKVALHEELHRKMPVDLDALVAIEGVGPKGVQALYEELGIRTVEDLEKAARSGKVRDVPGFGEKSEQKILRGIGFLATESGRLPIGRVLPVAREIVAHLETVKGVERIEIAGSLRRRKETIGDIDILVVSKSPERVMEEFVSLPDVVDVLAHGKTKSSIRLSIGTNADLRVVPKESFGAAMQYFTGSKDHGVGIRKIAVRKKLKLNEYGVFRGEKPIAGADEEEVYEALGLPWIPPELREDRGEVEAALEGKLPDLVGYDDLRGDLQTQTNWTDGKDSIEAMAKEAAALGLEYIAVTDHTRALTMVRGSDEKKLRRQMKEIDRINGKLRKFRILKGAEVNIQKDGSLDIDDETLAELDVVGVAVHSYFNLSRKEMTERICRAIRNPHADILFHPTGRVLRKREAYDVDMEEVLRTAVETGTALEIDAFPERLDLNEDHARQAIEAGANVVIDTDAHSIRHLPFLEYGIGIARRAWVPRERVLNTLPVEKLLASLKDGRGSRTGGKNRSRRKKSAKSSGRRSTGSRPERRAAKRKRAT